MIMKSKWIFMFIVISLIFAGCNEQNDTNETNSVSSKNEPKENIKVNKEYDQNGNLIRYDSTYSYFYSNIEGDKIAEDSIYQNFRKMFKNTYPFSQKHYFDNMFFQDSLMKYDFYKDDFFANRFKQNMQHMDRLFWEMDSLKNHFFMEQFPKHEN